MTQKFLFYTNDSGELNRNYYCLECDSGPFTQTDIDNQTLIEKGYGKQTVYYCRKCCLIKFRCLPEISVRKTAELPITAEEISLENLSGSEIIKLVKIKAECFIPISPKSKKSVLKRAKKILEEKGFKVK
jgi:hypothetical protein